MSSDVAFLAVQAFLAANFKAVPVYYENTTIPQANPPAPYVFAEMFGTNWTALSFGTGDPHVDVWEETGLLMAHTFVPSASGSLHARQIATGLAGLLRGLILPGNMRFETISVGAGGSGDEDGLWWTLTLRAEWKRQS